MRRPRDDFAGADWLITSRGLSKRAVFETSLDVERFCDALARVVDLGLVEVDAYVFLTTHFHLLLRSVTGEISLAMKLVLNEFVRWFNRTRKRDGSLFAGRFDGRRIDDGEYWCAALRYIDLNPVRAKMCALPSDHPFGSARAYRYGLAPPWLTQTRVLNVMSGFHDPTPYRPELYDSFAACTDEETNAHLIERLARSPERRAPPLADLVRTASRHQRGWMEWKAALADGLEIGTGFLPVAEATRAAANASLLIARVTGQTPAESHARDLRMGLLRAAAGLGIHEIADLEQASLSTVHKGNRRHRDRMTTQSLYADSVSRAVRRAVRRVFADGRAASEHGVRVHL